MAMIRTIMIAYIKKFLSIFFIIFGMLYVLDAYITNYGSPWPNRLDPESIGMPVYPYATCKFGWPKDKRPVSDLSISRDYESPIADYCFGYQVPDTGAEPILKFYSDELTKRGWKIKGKPENTWNAEYKIRSYDVSYEKYSMKLYLSVEVYYSKSSIYWYFKKSVPTDVKICIYK